MPPETCTIVVDGASLEVPAGASLAAALVAAQRPTRRSVGGLARAPLCAMGSCFECTVTIQRGEGALPERARACLEPCQPGLRVETGVGAEPEVRP